MQQVLLEHQVLHYDDVNVDTSPILKEVMTFTIEPMVNLGKPELKILSDKWTAVTQDGQISAQFEHTLYVTETGINWDWVVVWGY